jgi:hypothetical protein
MYYAMKYRIRVGRYAVKVLDSVRICKSVENLSDTAEIVLPGTYMNRALQIENRVSAGDAVEIWLGYNDGLQMEFKGYVNAVSTDDAVIRIECIDDLYLFKKPLKDREYKSLPLEELLRIVTGEVNRQSGASFSVSCDYAFQWEKFVFFKATALDVLKKVQDETKANIYFREHVLHIHPPYSEISNREAVVYDFSRNVEQSNLKYVLQENRKIEIEVRATLPDGKTKKISYGTAGGEKHVVELSAVSESGMKARAEQEYSLFAYDGYEGNFTGWLLPYVEPAYKIHLRDADYPYKDGDYYVVAVDVRFGSGGGERTVTLGRKLNA